MTLSEEIEEVIRSSTGYYDVIASARARDLLTRLRALPTDEECERALIDADVMVAKGNYARGVGSPDYRAMLDRLATALSSRLAVPSAVGVDREVVIETACKAAVGNLYGWAGQWETYDEGDREALRRLMGPIVGAILAAISPKPPIPEAESFQARVAPWMQACFGPEISADKLERNDRFLEEAVELTQASGYTRERAHLLVDYVFNRPQGEINQEVGGVMVTLAAHCLAHGVDMHAAGETELVRILQPEIITKIRAKQAAKTTGSALPVATPPAEKPAVGVEELTAFMTTALRRAGGVRAVARSERGPQLIPEICAREAMAMLAAAPAPTPGRTAADLLGALEEARRNLADDDLHIFDRDRAVATIDAAINRFKGGQL